MEQTFIDAAVVAFRPADQSSPAARSWLESFGSSTDAWRTCLAVAQAPGAPAEAQLFAAQVLRHRTAREAAGLPGPAQQELRAGLAAALQAAQAGGRQARTHLCIALASLLAQTAAAEEELRSLEAAVPHEAMLQVLAELPGAAGDRAPQQGALQPRAKVAGWGPFAMRWLWSALHKGRAASSPGPYLRAFGAWAQLGCLDLADACCTDLLQLTFASLTGAGDDSLREDAQQAAEAVIEGAPEQLAPELLRVCLGLPAQALQALQQGSPERFQCLAGVFLAFCLCSAELWASPAPEGASLRQGHAALATAPPLPNEAGCPVSVPALEAWALLAAKGVASASRQRTNRSAGRRELEAGFAALLAGLLPRLPQLSQADADGAAGSCVAEALEECCRVMGADQYVACLTGAADGTLQARLLAVAAAERPLARLWDPGAAARLRALLFAGLPSPAQAAAGAGEPGQLAAAVQALSAALQPMLAALARGPDGGAPAEVVAAGLQLGLAALRQPATALSAAALLSSCAAAALAAPVAAAGSGAALQAAASQLAGMLGGTSDPEAHFSCRCYAEGRARSRRA